MYFKFQGYFGFSGYIVTLPCFVNCAAICNNCCFFFFYCGWLWLTRVLKIPRQDLILVFHIDNKDVYWWWAAVGCVWSACDDLLERHSKIEEKKNNKELKIKELLQLNSGHMGYRALFLFLETAGLNRGI